MTADKLPTIVVTGASGFIGSYFLETVKEEYFIYAIARRSQREAEIPKHRNIQWIMVDIADEAQLRREIEKIKLEGADFIVHLAAFYNFDYLDNPEYERTNVGGTLNMLEAAKYLEVKRFIFASSITVSEFPRPEGPLTEQSPTDAEFPYARSKRKGEELVRRYSRFFPCTVIRMAAVFSDWCEYGPLYVLLSTWFAGKWNSNVLGGRGETAMPYIHVLSVIRLYRGILELSPKLSDFFDIYIASPSTVLSHRELFELATRLYFGKATRPITVPKPLAAFGILLRDLLGRLIGKRPFERLWMVQYIDKQLIVDPTYTRMTVPIEPKPRNLITRRLVFMIENLKSYPVEWHARNAAVLKRGSERPNLLVTDIMHSRRVELIEKVHNHITSPVRLHEFEHYQLMDPDKLKWYIELVYRLLMASVRNGDRMSLLSYARYLASVRRKEGFGFSELQEALLATGNIIIENLLSDPELEDMEQILNDSIRLTIELAIDEVEDAYEQIPAVPIFRRTPVTNSPVGG
ncbi:MAG: NAD(P)-dependent oxidoreductase [bacterium]|nr:NAD(P)-dependent oxidoreductase [bacterium]